jgi:U3 small nucleolar RNA-associated protein 10
VCSEIIVLFIVLGLEGLRELEKLERKFKEFEKLLFSESAKSLQRAVQTAEVNAKLDTHIRKFLLLLSPHLLLKPALSALEWLVQR